MFGHDIFGSAVGEAFGKPPRGGGGGGAKHGGGGWRGGGGGRRHGGRHGGGRRWGGGGYILPPMPTFIDPVPVYPYATWEEVPTGPCPPGYISQTTTDGSTWTTTCTPERMGAQAGFGEAPVSAPLQIEDLAGIPTVTNKVDVHAVIDPMNINGRGELLATADPAFATVKSTFFSPLEAAVMIRGARVMARGSTNAAVLLAVFTGADLVKAVKNEGMALFDAPLGSQVVLDAMKILGTTGAIPKGIPIEPPPVRASAGSYGWVVPVAIVGGIGLLAYAALRR